MNSFSQKFITRKDFWSGSLRWRRNKFGFTAISTVTAKRRIHFFMDATLQLMAGFSVGPSSDFCLESSHRSHTCSALKTVNSRWSLTKLEQAEWWLGSNSRLRILSHSRIVSTATTLAKMTHESSQKKTTTQWAPSSATASLSCIMFGSKSRRS